MFSLTQNENIELFKSVILLLLIGSSLVIYFRSSPGTALKYISIWAFVLILLVFGYSFRYEVQNVKNRIIGELLPSSATNNQDGSISFRASRSGHYNVNAKINGVNIMLMVDTGASDVVLTLNDAKKIGINIQDLNFNRMYHTANGTTYGAPIIIREIALGNVVAYNVRASVNQSDMDKSLLGMSFLERLGGYEVRNGVLTIWSAD